MSGESSPEERARLEREADLRAVLQRPEGRRLVWRLVETECGTFGPSFAPGDPLATAYGEGRRSLGIALMEEARRVAPREWVEAMGEVIERRRLEKEKSPPASAD